jgi:NADH-ubiquinone oxidoreductase chain 1
MTEHAAVIFVFFFLAEYASIVIMCIFTSILFLGGYLSFIPDILYSYLNSNLLNNQLYEGLRYSLSLGIKSSAMVFSFI